MQRERFLTKLAKEIVRKRVQQRYNVGHCFENWEALIAHNKSGKKIEAHAVIICVQDQNHRDCAIAFANEGYHILLEKPMAVSAQDCKDIVEAVERNKIMLGVCHVLRYSLLTTRVKKIITDGGVGQIMNVQHVEPVGHWHFAHVRCNLCFGAKLFSTSVKSFVRGNWRNEQQSTFMLLAKSCHDVDWLMYIMKQDAQKPVKVKRLNSFGSLVHFTPKNKPLGAADRCLQCPAHIERQCPYSAKRIYLDRVKEGYTEWPVKVIVQDGSIPDIENVTEALEKTNYGKCVYGPLDNDVVDQQTVMIELDTGATATLSVVAFSHEICQRKTRIYGSMGEIDIDGHKIRHVNFKNGQTTHYDIDEEMKAESVVTRLTGHGYADFYLMKAFIDAVQFNDPSKLLTDARETLFTHLLTFDAEKSRLNKGEVIHYE